MTEERTQYKEKEHKWKFGCGRLVCESGPVQIMIWISFICRKGYDWPCIRSCSWTSVTGGNSAIGKTCTIIQLLLDWERKMETFDWNKQKNGFRCIGVIMLLMCKYKDIIIKYHWRILNSMRMLCIMPSKQPFLEFWRASSPVPTKATIQWFEVFTNTGQLH